VLQFTLVHPDWYSASSICIFAAYMRRFVGNYEFMLVARGRYNRNGSLTWSRRQRLANLPVRIVAVHARSAQLTLTAAYDANIRKSPSCTAEIISSTGKLRYVYISPASGRTLYTLNYLDKSLFSLVLMTSLQLPLNSGSFDYNYSDRYSGYSLRRVSALGSSTLPATVLKPAKVKDEFLRSYCRPHYF